MGLIDLTGKKYGKLTVIKRVENHVSKNGNSRPAWLCRCECGNEVVVMGLNLTRGHTVSCGCARKDGRKKLMVDVTGQKYGRLTALRHIENNRNGTYWLFKCDCGNEKEILLQNVKSGKTLSCGKCKKTLGLVKYNQNGIIGSKHDLTGQKYGMLTVKERIVDTKTVKYICECDCGNECIKTHHSLIYNTKKYGTNSCGCLQKKAAGETHGKKIAIGSKFNHLTVIDQAPSKYGKLHWLCKCDCGKETIVSSGGLTFGHTKSCGCFQDEVASNTHLDDLTNQKYGMLTVLRRDKDGPRGEVSYLCQCECGNRRVIQASSLKTGLTQSCGCFASSFGEKYIDDILSQMHINYKSQIRYDDLRGVGKNPLSYDFGIYNSKWELVGLIEYQGEQHYKAVKMFGGQEQFERQKFHDELKREYAKNYLNVPLLEVPYTIRCFDDVRRVVLSFCGELLEEYKHFNVEDIKYRKMKKSKQKKVLCIELNELFDSALLAAEFCGKDNPEGIYAACNGSTKSAYGYHWKYIEEQQE